MIMRVYFNKITTVHFSNPITFSRSYLYNSALLRSCGGPRFQIAEFLSVRGFQR